ncbi:putative Glutamate carboxypeptidase II [Heterostelium album PN500]|uniref:Putative Glutamate carboxypeptidase II n=1 Tax=Heterostelium pallidum (strain ATCC 26659 / Pp 5 / PN500) TaxID=670386 RepID=D3BEU1_HETP5|nr:putative Glutamate carboxypeptidase II [Heterostelium album PN500]EFA80422.1 putative Glutamate carboxypeptidase II [Heterostelium album PN500]|eukprot:XP_020432542.1 putative Glutamate carboxypeptidase II [Heterostelium album PN500]
MENNSQSTSMLQYIYSPRCMRGSGLVIGILALLFSVILLSISLSNSLDHSAGNDNNENTSYENNKLPLWVLDNIKSNRIRENTIKLSSDVFQGREPGTLGEQMAVDFVQTVFQTIGLEPHGDNDSYIQKVPIYSFKLENPQLKIDSTDYTFLVNYTLSTELRQESVSLDSIPMVFVGYGIVAPEHDWNDYKNVDVKDKIAVAFSDNPSTFSNNYGRATVKYEFARQHGCAGLLFIYSNTTTLKVVPWDPLVQQYAIQQIVLSETVYKNPLQVKGWLSYPNSVQLAADAGATLAQWEIAANSKSFQPIQLKNKYSVTFNINGTVKDSQTVIGGFVGTKNPSEVVVMMAHHDHLGTLNVGGKTQIFHGAVDNAAGVSILMEVATALGLYQKIASTPTFSQVGPIATFERTVLFISVTGEEYGFLGSQYFLNHLPRVVANQSSIVAMVNFDTANVYNETTDVVSLGFGFSKQLDQVLNVSAADENMTVSQDIFPNLDFLYRTDEFPFLQSGIPATTLSIGQHFINQSIEYYQRILITYLSTRYHTPSDVVLDEYTFLGTVQQARIAARLIYYLGNSNIKPNMTSSIQ